MKRRRRENRMMYLKKENTYITQEGFGMATEYDISTDNYETSACCGLSLSEWKAKGYVETTKDNLIEAIENAGFCPDPEDF
jgi:hypothetical protein